MHEHFLKAQQTARSPNLSSNIICQGSVSECCLCLHAGSVGNCFSVLGAVFSVLVQNFYSFFKIQSNLFRNQM